MNHAPRPVTPEELRDEILDHMRWLVKYWATVNGPASAEERIDGALFSTLVMFDGCSTTLPAFDLVAKTHPEDKQFHVDRGENWIEDETRISDMLHERWYHDRPAGSKP